MLCALVLALPQTAAALVQAKPADAFHLRSLTCEAPVKLAHDCSIWQGATRPIAFGSYRMLLAADDAGSTILVSRIRLCPDHNDGAFVADDARSANAIIQELGDALEDRGIRLQRMQPVRDGRKIAAWFLEFSGDAYAYLKQRTVLESEYWLPDASPR